MDCWEEKDNPYYDYDRLALVGHSFKGLGQQDVQCKPQIDEPASTKQHTCSTIVIW